MLCQVGGELNRISRDMHLIARGAKLSPRNKERVADTLADIQSMLRLVRAAIEDATEGEP